MSYILVSGPLHFLNVREGGILVRTSGRYAPPYRVTSRTICARSFASSTTKTCPSILRWSKSAVTFGTFIRHNESKPKKSAPVNTHGAPCSRTETHYLERCDECMVRVQIRDHLKAAVEGDDLALDMFLQYPTYAIKRPHDDVPDVHPVRQYQKRVSKKLL